MPIIDNDTSQGTLIWLECPNFMPIKEGELWI